MRTPTIITIVGGAITLLTLARADVPTNCAISNLWGSWEFQLGLAGDAEAVTAGIKRADGSYLNLGEQTGTRHFRFDLYNLVTDVDTGTTGTVTTIYNQGFQFQIYNEQWFVYWYFESGNGYDCSKSSVGWVKDNFGHNYIRIQGTRQDSDGSQFVNVPTHKTLDHRTFSRKYTRDDEFIQRVNTRAGGVWTAKHYQQHEKYTLRELVKRSGVQPDELLGESGRFNNHGRNLDELFKRAMDKNEQVHSQLKREKRAVPSNLDWRNVDGVNYVSPVNDQANCGSCYSFGAMGLLESRIRVMTNNKQQPTFSEQEIITCGKDRTYNQGCNGGWSYFIAGKYAQDYGVVEENCNANTVYNTTSYDSLPCPDTSGCQRWYVDDYGYLGGYYGATENDGGLSMMVALQDGPVAVGFEVQGDFGSYSGGVWFDTGLTSDWNPVVQVNHAVLCVGYGVCGGVGDPLCGDETPKGMPYWIGKNSWGPEWATGGFFLILRGVNEVGWESMPFVVSPIPQF